MTPKARGNKASKLRSKMRSGGELTAAESEWFSLYEAKKERKGAPTKEAAEEKPDARPVEPVESAAPEDVPTAPPPDPPPEILKKAAQRPGKGDWRDGYRSAADSRESTCVELASYWTYWLKKMNADIVERDGKPFMSDELLDRQFMPCAVLTVDRLLPERFNLSAEVKASIITTGTVGKRWWVSRQAAKPKLSSIPPEKKVVPMAPAKEAPKAETQKPPEPDDKAETPAVKDVNVPDGEVY